MKALQQNAARVSAYLLERLQALRHPFLTQARASGLFFGVEFTTDGIMPAGDFVGNLVEDMVARGFLLNRIGRGANILKIRPPMPFSVQDADWLADALQMALDAA